MSSSGDPSDPDNYPSFLRPPLTPKEKRHIDAFVKDKERVRRSWAAYMRMREEGIIPD
jgi:hypothetical protein